MPPITRFEEIEAWQTARALTRRLYALTADGAWRRDYGLRDQIRRASVSIMSNIAEGYESGSRSQFHRYLGYAKASAGEVRAQMYVALDAGYLDQIAFAELFDVADKCSRQLSRLMAYLKPRQTRQLSEELGLYEIGEP